MDNFFINIISGIKFLGASSILYTLVCWLVFLLIDVSLMKSIETLLKMEHKIYWYDVVILAIWICLYVYGFYIVGKTINQ